MNQIILSLPEAHAKLVPDSILTRSVSIFGLGHLGSWAAYTLSKLGICEFYLYDNDEIENRNISGTVYDSTNVGYFKTNVLSEIIQREVEYKFVSTSTFRVRKRRHIKEDSHYFILAVDSIEARSKIFDAILAYRIWQLDNNSIQPLNSYLIDMRTRADIGEFHIVDINNIDAIRAYAINLEMIGEIVDPEPLSCNESNIISLISIMMGTLTSTLRSTLSETIKIGYSWKTIDSKELNLSILV